MQSNLIPTQSNPTQSNPIWFVCLSVCLSACSFLLSIYLPTYLSIYLSMHVYDSKNKVDNPSLSPCLSRFIYIYNTHTYVYIYYYIYTHYIHNIYIYIHIIYILLYILYMLLLPKVTSVNVSWAAEMWQFFWLQALPENCSSSRIHFIGGGNGSAGLG